MQYLEKLVEKIVRQNEHKFSIFAKRGYSFEEWLNLELCTSLCLDPSINADSVLNTPKYELENKRLDISFQQGNEKYAVELKIAHPGTLDKYKDACIDDLNKLQGAVTYDHRFFVLVVTTTLSAEDFSIDKEWNAWIGKIFAGHSYCSKSISYRENPGSTYIYISQITPV
ncbi:hypothetical protein [Vibrio metschnikovii]|uniref:hypothetical protein n=1 Tax=Vibrio metschnikovii TaxID=28172 RepID=UPI002FCB708F